MFVQLNGETIEINRAADMIGISLSDLATVYNDLTGKNIKKFSSKQEGQSRLWRAIQEVDSVPEETPEPAKQTGRKERIRKDAIIRVQVTENPKREGSSSYARFENYVDGMTVGQFLQKGGQLADIRWDTSKNFISLEES